MSTVKAIMMVITKSLFGFSGGDASTDHTLLAKYDGGSAATDYTNLPTFDGGDANVGK